MGGPTSDDLLAEAVAQTGLDDFGPGDLRIGLDTYVDALPEAQLSELGAMAVPGVITAALVNRLKVVDWAKAHPEVADEQIEAPVVVVGMFRAGTTFLSNLLERDPASRPLLRWESGDSVPPPGPADFREGPRVDASKAGNDMLEALNPHIRAIHHEEADGPTECIAVMAQDFKSLSWEAIANVPSYGTWLRSVDQTSAYEYHRTVLQVLQSGGVRGQWTLKSPHHALALEELTTVYPDAKLVLLHRDPVVLSASVCSLITTLSGTFTDADHQRYIADHWTSMLEQCVRRTDAFRAAHPEHPIIDVQYADLVGDPLGTLEGLYASLDLDLGGTAHDAMAAYVDARPKGAFGTHGYDLATYGLDADDLRARFQPYVDRHHIPTETPR